RRTIVAHADAGRCLERLEHYLAHSARARAAPAGDNDLTLVGASFIRMEEGSQCGKRTRSAATQNFASRNQLFPGHAVLRFDDGLRQPMAASQHLGLSSRPP